MTRLRPAEPGPCGPGGRAGSRRAPDRPCLRTDRNCRRRRRRRRAPVRRAQIADAVRAGRSRCSSSRCCSADDHIRRHRCRFLAVADEARHARRGMNGAPALRFQVDGDEQIARKQRRRDHLDLARMPAALEIARKIGIEALAGEVLGRLRFGMRLGLHHIPARSVMRSPPRRGRARRACWEPARARRRPALQRPRTLARGAPMSVTTTASNGLRSASNDATRERRRRSRDCALASTTATIVDAALQRTDRGDLGEIGHARRPRRAAKPRARGIANRCPRNRLGPGGRTRTNRPRYSTVRRDFSAKPCGRQVIGVTPRRRLADLDQPLLDAAFEIGVDEPERDAELGRQAALRLAAVALDQLSSPSMMRWLSSFCAVLVMRPHGHRSSAFYDVRRVNVKAHVHLVNADKSRRKKI